VDNVKTAIAYTMEHGVYSRSSAAKRRDREVPSNPSPMGMGKRPPGVCIPWEEESRGYTHLSGDAALVRNSWEEADFWVYNYIWTTLLW